MNASLGNWQDAAAAYQAAADAWGDTTQQQQQQQQQARALLGCGVALDRAVSPGTVCRMLPACSVGVCQGSYAQLLMRVEGPICSLAGKFRLCLLKQLASV